MKSVEGAHRAAFPAGLTSQVSSLGQSRVDPVHCADLQDNSVSFEQSLGGHQGVLCPPPRTPISSICD